MANSRDKFDLSIAGIESITEYKPNAIPLEHLFFRATRKSMRGLEERIIEWKSKHIGREYEHDYTEPFYCRVETFAGDVLYILFGREWVDFGAELLDR